MFLIHPATPFPIQGMEGCGIVEGRWVPAVQSDQSNAVDLIDEAALLLKPKIGLGPSSEMLTITLTIMYSIGNSRNITTVCTLLYSHSPQNVCSIKHEAAEVETYLAKPAEALPPI